MSGFVAHVDPTTMFHFTYPDSGIIYSVVDGKVVIEHENIAKLTSYQLVIADYSANHFGSDSGVINMTYDLLEQAGVNFIVISHCPSDHLKRPNLYYYPWFYYDTMTNIQLGNVDSSCNRKYSLSCLNGLPKIHRIQNYILLKKKSYFADCCTSFYSIGNREWYSRSDDQSLDSTVEHEWNLLSLTLPVFDARVWRNADHPAFTDSYVNLVTESGIQEKLFISEKTWKPIAHAQLFLILGNPGTVEHLRNSGVDTFDDIIDHKYYDHEPDWKVRIDKIHLVLDSLLSQDLEQLYHQTQTRRELNRQRFHSGDFDKNQYHNLLVSKIQERKH
jgi:hypothetical protein